MELSVLKPKEIIDLPEIFDEGAKRILFSLKERKMLNAVKDFKSYSLTGLKEAKDAIEEVIIKKDKDYRGYWIIEFAVDDMTFNGEWIRLRLEEEYHKSLRRETDLAKQIEEINQSLLQEPRF